ncbi:MAG: metallophosphoesterase [Candidatus Eremiobacteraeota bacterium]|nr:metallophosphoesterase [Candidatus Eremiobacteraeota bacterium]
MFGGVDFPSSFIPVDMAAGKKKPPIRAEKPVDETGPTDSYEKKAANDNTAPSAEEAARSKEELQEEEKAGQDTGDLENALKITILHTNDIHGMEEKLPALKALIEDLRQDNPSSILVDSGDIAYSAKPTEGDHFDSVKNYINEAGYFAIVPGNHDFQWGKDEAVKDFFTQVKTDVLCANVHDTETGKHLAGTKTRVMKELDGLKVAFIGVTTTKMATPDHPDTGDDLIVFPEYETLQSEVAQAKKEGADIVVALMHKGYTDIKEFKDLARRLPDIDLMVLGHDHELHKTSLRTGPMPHRTYIVEAGCYGNYVGGVNFYVDKDSKKIIKAQMKSYPTKNYTVTAQDPAVSSSLESSGL